MKTYSKVNRYKLMIIAFMIYSCGKPTKPKIFSISSLALQNKFIAAIADDVKYTATRIFKSKTQTRVNINCAYKHNKRNVQIDYIFEDQETYKCLTNQSDKILQDKCLQIAKQFYALNIISFTKEFSGNTIYISEFKKPVVMEIINKKSFSESNLSGLKLIHYMGNYYYAEDPVPYLLNIPVKTH